MRIFEADLGCCAHLFAAEDQIRIFEYVHPLVLSLSPFLKSNMIKSNKNLKKIKNKH